MSATEEKAADVIEAYRRRRERTIPLLLGGLAVVLLAVGVFLVVIWFTGDNRPQLPGFLSSDTPTPSATATPPPPSETPTITLTLEPSETATPEGPLIYVVKEGDSLFSIAKEFEIEIDQLIAANPDLAESAVIFPNQELIIPPPDAEFPTPTPLEVTLVPGRRYEYRVRPGDNLQIIAAKFNTTAEAIARDNKIDDPNNIQVGQLLVIIVGNVTPTFTSTPDLNTPTATPLP